MTSLVEVSHALTVARTFTRNSKSLKCCIATVNQALHLRALPSPTSPKPLPQWLQIQHWLCHRHYHRHHHYQHHYQHHQHHPHHQQRHLLFMEMMTTHMLGHMQMYLIMFEIVFSPVMGVILLTTLQFVWLLVVLHVLAWIGWCFIWFLMLKICWKESLHYLHLGVCVIKWSVVQSVDL